jgi:hypothetical protein
LDITALFVRVDIITGEVATTILFVIAAGKQEIVLCVTLKDKHIGVGITVYTHPTSLQR